jgi:flagellar hook-associated protein 3 FlgL
MALSSIGDLARSFALRNQTTSLKIELDRRSFESSSGTVQDAGRALRGNFSSLTAIDATLTRLTAFRNVGEEADLSAQAMQSTFETISDLSTSLGSTLLSVAGQGEATAIDGAAQDAVARFRTAVASLNVRVADRSIFAGTETRNAALADPDDILDALALATSGATTAGELEAQVTSWFNDPAGFETVAYLGGAPLDPVTISDGEQVQLDATANDPAVRETLLAISMAALLDRGALSGQPTERARVAVRSGERLLEGETSRSALAARIGTAQERIEAASVRNDAEITSLRIARGALVGVDDYEAATALTEAESRLDIIYSITARLQKLSLAEYI